MTQPLQHGPQPSGDAPRRRRAGVIAGVTVGGLVLLGGVGTSLYFLLGNGADAPADGSPQPRQAAERYAEAYTRTAASGAAYAPEAFVGVVCAADLATMRELAKRDQARSATRVAAPTPMSSGKPRSPEKVTVKEVRDSGDRGVAILVRSRTSPNGRTDTRDRRVDLVKDGSGWKVCGVFRSSAPSTSRATASQAGTHSATHSATPTSR
ncbi:hypothetical protein [Solihabitans fulvus]|uniref:hypothetical protein n=1 Tax=Solihabitans fulvus TaxID=1892852 RepID=UPI001661FE9A|nr:hypothetical protein [Solihabitans fulvus]